MIHIRKVLLLPLIMAATFLGSGCTTVFVQKAEVHPQPDDEHGLVYFYRENRVIGSAVTYFIYEGKEKIGGLMNRSYFFVLPTVGDHTYESQLEGTPEITLQVEANKTYYVRSDLDMGFFGPSGSMIEVTEREASQMLPKLSRVGLNREP